MNSLRKDVANLYGADYIVKKSIEIMEIKWALIDPLSLPDCYQICDGSSWYNPSYAKTYWEAKGIYNIPDLRGFHLRAAALGSSYDPDRNSRRQVTKGNVAVGANVAITLSKYHTKLIYEAFSKGRPVIIGLKPGDMFSTLTVYGTVAQMSVEANQVILSSVTGTFTTASNVSLVLQGDLAGSFQSDAIRNIYGVTGGIGFLRAGELQATGPFYITGTYTGPEIWGGGTGIGFDASRQVPTASDNRPKNIALLPIMYVRLPSKSTDSIEFVPETISNLSSVQIPTSNFGETIDGYAKFVDSKPSGTDGGSASAATWNLRTLNTTIFNSITGASLNGSNQITLPIGTYDIRITCPAYGVSNNRAVLYNVTDSTYAIIGVDSYTNNTYGGCAPALAGGRITLTSPKTFEVRHYTASALATNGLGVKTSCDINEIYTQVEITKIKSAVPYLDIETRAFNGIDSRIFTRQPIENLIIKNNTTNPNYQVDISFTGLKCEDQYYENFSQTLDITVAGSLDTGLEEISKWYYIWFLMGPGLPAKCIFSTSYTSPVMPTSFTKRKLIGAVYNNASGHFNSFHQIDKIWSIQPITIANITLTSFSQLTALLTTIPYNTKIIRGMWSNSVTGAGIFLSPFPSGHGYVYCTTHATYSYEFVVHVYQQKVYGMVTSGTGTITLSHAELDI